jgi:hypothetical protein
MSSSDSLNKSDGILGVVNLSNVQSGKQTISQSVELTQYSDLRCSCLAISFPLRVEKNGFFDVSKEASCLSNHAFRAGRAGAIDELWKPDMGLDVIQVI